MLSLASQRARRNEALFYTFLALNNFGFWTAIWIKYLTEDRGLQLKYILLMDLPFWLMVAVLQAPMGALADRVGRRRVLVAAGLTYSATILGFGLTTNYWLLFADYMLWALALSLQTGADQALVYDTLKEAGDEERFRRVAGRGFATVLLSGFVSAASGGYMAAAFGSAFAVQISALAPLAAAGAALAMYEPRLPQREERHYWRDLRAGMEFAWNAPQVRYTLLLGSLILTAGFAPVVLVQPFLGEHEGSTEQSGLFQAPLRLAWVAGALLAARLALGLGTGRVIPAACLGLAVSYVGLAVTGGTGAFGWFGVAAVLTGLTRPVMDNHLNERIPSERRATVLSIMSLLFSLQVAFFEPALGFITDDVSLTAAFAFSALFFMATFPGLLFLWTRAHREGRVGEVGAELRAAGGD